MLPIIGLEFLDVNVPELQNCVYDLNGSFSMFCSSCHGLLVG